MHRLCPAALLAVLALSAVPAQAHPHIFIDAEATIVFDDNGTVTGIRHAWTFDEAFSVWQVQGLDVNGDGITSSEEMQELAEDNMVGLAEYQYYTFAGEGADNLVFATGQRPRFEHVDGRSTLRFEVELASPYRIRDTLEIAVNDPEYYVAIDFADAASVALENAPTGCTVTLQQPRELAPELAAQLYALPPEVTELPPDLAIALRGVQGAILVACPAGPIETVPGTATGAAEGVAMAAPVRPFGGPPPEPGLAMPTGGLLGWVADQQRTFYQALTAALGELRNDHKAFWVLGTLSFLYGVFHAAGPGHGKIVISSYVLANEREVRRGIGLSFAAAMLQAAVAVVLVLVAAAALQLTAAAMGRLAGWIGVASYALVALLGLWLVMRKLFGWGHAHGPQPGRDLVRRARTLLRPESANGAGRAAGCDHDHGHDHHHHLVTPQQVQGGWREQLGVVLAVGLRPCSGALVVLVFALSQGLLAAGVAAVFLMGLGTGITVAVLATMALTAKGFAGRYAAAGGGSVAAVVWWAELVAAVLVCGFGVLLLVASLG